jgi:hypothetical protein
MAEHVTNLLFLIKHDIDDLGNLTTHDLSDEDIRIEYHPKSGKLPVIQTFDEYTTGSEQASLRPPLDTKPWLPFCTRLDFEVAALTLECHMNRQQTDTLFKLIAHIQQGFD